MGENAAFFYGTLMAREILNRVCYGPGNVGHDPEATRLAAHLKIQSAILHDYSRRKVRGCDYPGIIPQKGHTVRGTYVTGLTDRDIYRLDTFEGSEYDRIKIKIRVLGMDGEETKEVEAETYVYSAGDKRLEGKEWDYKEFRKEKMHRWTNESVEYQEVDEAVANGHDPTGGRRVAASGTYGKTEEEMLGSAV